MIRILELESSKGWGGQEKRTVRLVNSLDKSKFQVFWGAQKGSKLLEHCDSIHAKFFTLSLRQSYDLLGILQVIYLVLKYKIDIISTHSGKDAWIGAIAGLLTKTKVIRIRHLQTPVKSPFSYNLSNYVVTVSKQVNHYLESIGVKKDKLKTIYTGIDTTMYTPNTTYNLRKELLLPSGTIIIGIVAVLRIAKRHIDLINAFSKLNTHETIALIIVGTGPQENNLKEYVKSISLSPNKSILFLGHREDIPLILPCFNLFVLPSNMEALGTAILEASSCGIPCIGSNVGGIPECIKDGYTGFLFEKENVIELTEKLEILVNNTSLQKTFGINARNLIQNEFSIISMKEKTEKLYKEILL